MKKLCYLEEDWYSGYLHYDVPFENGTARAVHTHYVYVDSGSDDSPLIFWTNGKRNPLPRPPLSDSQADLGRLPCTASSRNSARFS